MKRRRWMDEADLWVLLICIITVCMMCAHSLLYLWRLYH